VVSAQLRTDEPGPLTLAKAEEQSQHMNVCTVVVRPLNLRHCVHHLVLERIIESSLLFAKVTLDDSDGLRRKVENLDSVDGVVF